MNTMPRHHLSIKFKLLLAIIPILALLGFVTTALVSAYVRSSFIHDLEKQQFTLVTLMAQKLDDQFGAYQKTLASFSKNLPPALLDNPKALEQYIDDRPALSEIFDNNVVVFDPVGVVLAETAQRPSRTGAVFTFGNYIPETSKLAKPLISRPFESKLPNHPPVVMFTAPVFDRNGKVVAVVGGSINLLRPNLLGKLATTKIGVGGYFYLSDLNRTMIMHPDQARMLKRAFAQGKNSLYDKALAGFEGAGETTSVADVAMLAAFKRLKSVNWLLVAQIPVAEAYRSVNTAQSLTWGITAIALLFLGTLTIIAASRMLAPLQSLTAQVALIGHGDGHRLVKVDSNDEISTLAAAFNNLMYQLDAREQDLRTSRELFQFISDFSQDWIFWRVPDGAMLYISPAAEKITGYSINELMYEPELAFSMIHPDDRELFEQYVCKVEQGQENNSIEFRIISKSGQVRWLRHFCSSICDADGVLLGVRGTNRDITERKLALLSLKENEEQFRLIASTAHDAIIMADPQQLISFWNQAAETLFGAESASVIGTPLATFVPGLVDAVHQAESGADSGLTLEISGCHQAGHLITVELAYSQAKLSGAPVTVVVARDITERKQTEDRLRFISSHDALTGLNNRTAFEYYVAQLDTEGPFPVAVIMADLDGLKKINDTQGHEAGDRLIQAAADLLSSSFRTNDIVARIGGDEFAVLLPGIPEDAAYNNYERLQRRIDLFSELPENPTVSLSCGMTQVTEAGQLADAIKQADQLMYQQKFARKRLT
jgi:diguanylate cyclase (GGDEF)-like protein/PAS domain S-box-containing protein